MFAVFVFFFAFAVCRMLRFVIVGRCVVPLSVSAFVFASVVFFVLLASSIVANFVRSVVFVYVAMN